MIFATKKRFFCPNLCSGRGECAPDENTNSSRLKCHCHDDKKDEEESKNEEKESNGDDRSEEDCSDYPLVFHALNETCSSASYTFTRRPFFLNILVVLFSLFFGYLFALHA